MIENYQNLPNNFNVKIHSDKNTLLSFLMTVINIAKNFF